MLQMIIDRFEGNFAVCEKAGGQLTRIARSKIPAEAREGDVLLLENDSLTIDIQATAERKKSVLNKFQNLSHPD
jgi:hypothetical protein